MTMHTQLMKSTERVQESSEHIMAIRVDAASVVEAGTAQEETNECSRKKSP